jgi:hypothetical protein
MYFLPRFHDNIHAHIAINLSKYSYSADFPNNAYFEKSEYFVFHYLKLVDQNYLMSVIMQGGLHEVLLVFIYLLVLRIVRRRRSRAEHEDGEKQIPNIEHFHTLARALSGH